MKRSTTLILALFALGACLAACAPSQAEQDAEATQIAAEVFATQTAAAPSPTLSPTALPTHTITPSLTPNPTATPPPPTATATPGPESRLARLEVALWPDYDRPAVLVLLTGDLPADVTYPTSVQFRLPVAVAEINAVAQVTADGNMFNAVYRTRADGDATIVTAEITEGAVRIEYYFDYQRTGDRITFNYEWLGGIAADELTIEFQEPAGAMGVVAGASFVDDGVRDDGRRYWLWPAGAIGSDEGLVTAFGYTTPPPDSKQTPPPLQAGWRDHAAADFRLALPEGWKAVDIDKEGINAVLAALEGLNSAWAQNLTAMVTAEGMEQMLKFWAIDSRPAGTGYATANVTSQSLPIAMSAADLCAQLPSIYEQMGIEMLEAECELEINALEADRFTIRLQTGPLAVQQYQYIYVQGVRFWTLSLAVDETVWSDYEPTFVTIGESFWLDE